MRKSWINSCFAFSDDCTVYLKAMNDVADLGETSEGFNSVKLGLWSLRTSELQKEDFETSVATKKRVSELEQTGERVSY